MPKWNEESERIIDIIIETAYLDINGIYNFGGSFDILQGTVIEKRPFISAYERIEERMHRDIDRFIETMSAD